MADDENKSKQKDEYTVLPSHMSGGPHGLGDPESRELRKVEKEIIIPKMMKEGAKEKCADLVKVFTDCGKTHGLMLPFRCRKENKALQDCIMTWFSDPKYYEEMKEVYLLERSEYRATGISKKQRRKESATF